MLSSKLGWYMSFGFLFWSSVLSAQYSLSGFSLSDDPVSWYDNQVGTENTLLLNGEKVEFTRKSPVSHAYYLEMIWIDMEITYSGQLFRKVPALYNLEEDFLIVKKPNSIATPFKLTRDLVSSFKTGEDHFIFINDTINHRPEGYYKLLYESENMRLLGKVFKQLNIVSGVLTYTQDQEYFLEVANSYHRVVRFGDLKKLFPAYKRELKVRKKELSLKGRYTEGKEARLVQLVKFCDNIKAK